MGNLRGVRSGSWLTLLLSLTLFGQLLPAPAAAAIYNCGGLGHFFAGYSASTSGEPHYYEGASANIIYRQAALCSTDSTPNNSSTGWTMIAAGDSNGWAQSGLINYPGLGCWKHFAQQAAPGFPLFTVIQYCVTIGVSHVVWQRTKYNSVKGLWVVQSMIDNTVFLDSGYAPPSGWSPFAVWASPFVPQFLGETHHNASDVPGSASAKLDYSSMYVQELTDDTWHDTCGYITLYGGADPRYATDAPSCNHTRVWTSG